MKTIYLDYAATTPADPQVIDLMLQYLGKDDDFGNPASDSHIYGHQSRAAVERAREQVADLIAARPDEIIWTSGATEASNLAIKGVIEKSGIGKPHIITSALEHKATLDTCQYLERKGISVTYLRPAPNGSIDPQSVAEALRPSTALVSLMHVNNELGTISDIASIGEIIAETDALFHVDAAQSGSRLPLDAVKMKIDLVSLSGHKMYGPKGIGVLYVNRRCYNRLMPQIHGGGHELGFRSGTLPTHQIVGMGKAAELVAAKSGKEQKEQAGYTKDLLEAVKEAGNIGLNGANAPRVPGILNLTIKGVEAEALIATVPELAFSYGSACTAQAVEPSHVLLGIGLAEEQARQSIRLSIGRFTTGREIKTAGNLLVRAIQELRELAQS